MFTVNLLAGLLLLTSLLVIMAKTARRAALCYAAQSLVLVLLFVCLATELHSHALYMWAISAVITKVILVPMLIVYATRKIADCDITPNIHAAWLIPIAALIVITGFLAVEPIQLPLAQQFKPVLSVSLSHFLFGLLCIVSQRNIIKQLFGYCLMENGSHLTLALLANQAPELVEIGIATDALFAVIVLLVLVRKIYRSFNTLDAERLMDLRG